MNFSGDKNIECMASPFTSLCLLILYITILEERVREAILLSNYPAGISAFPIKGS